MSLDRILTVNEYYDGPRLGVAELDGVPHIYEAEFDHSSDEYGDTYFLSPIDNDLLSLVIEDWEIWIRWETAFKENKVAHETHPALPHERARHEAIKQRIGNRLRVDPLRQKHFRAKFGNNGMTVEWCKL